MCKFCPAGPGLPAKPRPRGATAGERIIAPLHPFCYNTLVDLQTGLDIVPGELVAFTGAGGKTSAIWRLLCLLVGSGWPVVFATTTRIFEPEGLPLLVEPEPSPDRIAHALAQAPALVLAGWRGEPGDPAQTARCPYPARPVKLLGLSPGRLSWLSRHLPGVTWLVEADGARGRQLKAPAPYEPAIPSAANRVVVVAGLGALGQPLDEETTHRPALAAQLLRVQLGTAISPEMVARLLSHPAGGLKGVPDGAAVVALLTQTSELPHVEAGAIAERLLCTRSIGRVVLANLWAPEPVLEVWP